MKVVKPGTDGLGRNPTLGIGFHGIIGWKDFVAQPSVHGPVPGSQRAQAITNDFTLASILA